MAKPVWTNAQIIDQLDTGNHWSGTNLTYGFPTNANWTPYGEKNGFSPLNTNQQAAATLAITLWDQLIVPNFTLAADGTTANIKYSNTTTARTQAPTTSSPRPSGSGASRPSSTKPAMPWD